MTRTVELVDGPLSGTRVLDGDAFPARIPYRVGPTRSVLEALGPDDQVPIAEGHYRLIRVKYGIGYYRDAGVAE